MKILRTPILPYKGTSGWQGSETSKERALRNDATITGNRQKQVYDLVRKAKRHGITAKEAREKLGFDNPNQVSPSLTILHKTGHITRLTEKRGAHQIYVLPSYVDGREESRYGGRA